jgi:hypothetical protein
MNDAVGELGERRHLQRILERGNPLAFWRDVRMAYKNSTHTSLSYLRARPSRQPGSDTWRASGQRRGSPASRATCAGAALRADYNAGPALPFWWDVQMPAVARLPDTF